MVSSVAALAVRHWLPEPSHISVFILIHSLCAGMLLVISVEGDDRPNLT